MTEPDEVVERLTAQLNHLVSLESVGVMVKTADLAAVLVRAARIKELEAALDQIYDLLFDAMQADCENGVRSLNEAAAANYLKDFPHTKKALTDIQAVCRSMLKDPDQ